MPMARAAFVSPKQVARALGVSESSLKRWCDQGHIASVRTVGGHRKMAVADVIRFVRDSSHRLVAPGVLGLPPASGRATTGLSQGATRLVESLLAGDELVSRQIVFDLYLAKYSCSVIFDEVIAKAFHDIGERWACQEVDVYQERRSCEIIHRLLVDLKRLQPTFECSWLAVGGTIEGDQYSLPSAMVEVILSEAGFQSNKLGTSIPVASLVRAVKDLRPKIVWLSVSHISASLDFVTEFQNLSKTCLQSGTALVVGGRALTEDLRQQLTYSAYCDTMQHLAAFAKTLYDSLLGSCPSDAPSQHSTTTNDFPS